MDSRQGQGTWSRHHSSLRARSRSDVIDGPGQSPHLLIHASACLDLWCYLSSKTSSLQKQVSSTHSKQKEYLVPLTQTGWAKQAQVHALSQVTVGISTLSLSPATHDILKDRMLIRTHSQGAQGPRLLFSASLSRDILFLKLPCHVLAIR